MPGSADTLPPRAERVAEGLQWGTETRCGSPGPPTSSTADYTPKLDPQPQVLAAFGFSNVKPRASSPSW